MAEEIHPQTRIANARRDGNEALRQRIKAAPIQECDSRAELRLDVIAHVLRLIDEKIPQLREGQGLAVSIDLEIVNSDFSFASEPSARVSPEGHAWRRDVFERDGFRCTECGCGDRIHAHHIKPWAEYPELRFVVDNGVTLCPDCHSVKHPGREGLIKKAKFHPGRAA